MSLHHGDRSLQREVQYRLRRKLDLLALGNLLRSGAHARASGAANRRALAATRDRADDAPKNRATANFFGGILAARTSFFAVLVGLQAIGLAARRKTIELEHNIGLAFKFPGALHINKVPLKLGSNGHGLFSVGCKGRVQSGAERVSALIFLAVDGIDQTNRKLRSLVDDEPLRWRWRRRSLYRRRAGGRNLRDLRRSAGVRLVLRFIAPELFAGLPFVLGSLSGMFFSFPGSKIALAISSWWRTGNLRRRRRHAGRSFGRRRGLGRTSNLQVVDDLFHSRDRSRLTTGGVTLRIIVDIARQRHHAVAGLHCELLAGEAGILAESVLNVSGKFCCHRASVRSRTQNSP